MSGELSTRSGMLRSAAICVTVFLAGCAGLGGAPLPFHETVTIGNEIFQVEWSKTATGIFAHSSNEAAAKVVALRECSNEATSIFSSRIDGSLATQWKCEPPQKADKPKG